MTSEQFHFLAAIDAFKKSNNKMFPTWTDVLEVVRLLGYRKTMPSELNLRNVEDWREKPDTASGVRSKPGHPEERASPRNREHWNSYMMWYSRSRSTGAIHTRRAHTHSNARPARRRGHGCLRRPRRSSRFRSGSVQYNARPGVRRAGVLVLERVWRRRSGNAVYWCGSWCCTADSGIRAAYVRLTRLVGAAARTY